VLPTFEHMGTKVVDERPYEISPREREPAWIYDFSLEVGDRDVARLSVPSHTDGAAYERGWCVNALRAANAGFYGLW
jgi:glutamate dehydrogenase